MVGLMINKVNNTGMLTVEVTGAVFSEFFSKQ